MIHLVMFILLSLPPRPTLPFEPFPRYQHPPITKPPGHPTHPDPGSRGNHGG